MGACSSKPGGLSDDDDADDEDEDDDEEADDVDELEEADECVDEADEQAVDELDKFLFTSLVMNNAAASISSFIFMVSLVWYTRAHIYLYICNNVYVIRIYFKWVRYGCL